MKKRGLNIIFSQGTKMALSMCLLVVFALFLCITSLLPAFQSSLEGKIQDNMLNMATAYRQLVEREEGENGENLVYERYAELLAEAKLTGVESSYAYLVDKSGTMLYHPTQDKVGQPVENVVVKSVVSDIQAGKVPEDTVTTYDFKGVIKYASYAVLDSHNILVISADEAEALADLQVIRKGVTTTGIAIVLGSIVIGVIISLFFILPLKKITKMIYKTSQFDFRQSKTNIKMSKRRDELGDVARAVQEMRENVKKVLNDLDTVGKGIGENVVKLETSSVQVNEMCSDNSATTEELSAGMEETTATTETIQEGISQVESKADDIRQLSMDGEKTSTEIKQRAEALRVTTEAAHAKANELHKSVLEKSEKAIEDSKAVSKINELTQAIMSISSQTSLLALNASIEAARAGEAGRGFAVVANEIGSLAGQTSQTVGDIDTIVKEVNRAVTNMTESLREAMDFLQNTVVGDYEQFTEVSSRYSADAQTFQSGMGIVNQSITSLADVIHEITKAIDGISTTINESATGVLEIAEKTADVVVKTGENNKMVAECNEYVTKLQEAVDLFTLE